MTAEALPEPEPAAMPADGTARTVRLIRESFAVAAPHAAEVTKFFYGMLFTLDPETRDLFPANMELQRDRLLGALVQIVQQVDQPDALRPYLRQLGSDHRKFGVITKHFEAVGIALISAVKRHAGEQWNDETERAWAQAYTTIATAMQAAAAEDSGPASWPAEVIGHERIGRELAIVRLRADYPVPYTAGQYLSVETPQRKRMWRYLTPANAPTEDGTLEFHLRAVPDGWVSGSLVAHTNIGDIWRLASPIGSLHVDRSSKNKVLMVAGGTGLAPMRAILESLAQFGENPDVHIFYGAKTSEDLYELENLRTLAAMSPWLTVTAVAEEIAPEAGGIEKGTLADVVTRHGSWRDREILVAGSPPMVRATVSRMLVAGTPLEKIHYDPFTMD